MSMVDAETDEDPDPLPLTTTCNHAKHAAVNVAASGANIISRAAPYVCATCRVYFSIPISSSIRTRVRGGGALKEQKRLLGGTSQIPHLNRTLA